MRTALDSSVILGVLVNDPLWAEASEAAIKQAYSDGQLLVGECVLAKGLITRNCLSNTCPDCMSSEYSASQSDSKALATICASKCESE